MTQNTLTHENEPDTPNIVYFPDKIGSWNLDIAHTTTNENGNPVVKELCYTTKLNDREISIYIEKDGIGYTGILHDITHLETNPHAPPLEQFSNPDALTLDEMMEHLTDWINNGHQLATL